MTVVYLASPLGFADSTKMFMSIIENQLVECGYNVINPWRLSDPKLFEAATNIHDDKRRIRALHKLNTQVAARNELSIHKAEIIVAVLDGVDAGIVTCGYDKTMKIWR